MGGVLSSCIAAFHMTIDSRTPIMPGWSTSGFHQPDRHRVHQAPPWGVERGKRGEGVRQALRPQKQAETTKAQHDWTLGSCGGLGLDARAPRRERGGIPIYPKHVALTGVHRPAGIVVFM